MTSNVHVYGMYGRLHETPMSALHLTYSYYTKHVPTGTIHKCEALFFHWNAFRSCLIYWNERDPEHWRYAETKKELQ